MVIYVYHLLACWVIVCEFLQTFIEVFELHSCVTRIDIKSIVDFFYLLMCDSQRLQCLCIVRVDVKIINRYFFCK